MSASVAVKWTSYLSCRRVTSEEDVSRPEGHLHALGSERVVREIAPGAEGHGRTVPCPGTKGTVRVGGLPDTRLPRHLDPDTNAGQPTPVLVDGTPFGGDSGAAIVEVDARRDLAPGLDLDDDLPPVEGSGVVDTQPVRSGAQPLEERHSVPHPRSGHAHRRPDGVPPGSRRRYRPRAARHPRPNTERRTLPARQQPQDPGAGLQGRFECEDGRGDAARARVGDEPHRGRVRFPRRRSGSARVRPRSRALRTPRPRGSLLRGRAIRGTERRGHPRPAHRPNPRSARRASARAQRPAPRPRAGRRAGRPRSAAPTPVRSASAHPARCPRPGAR